MAKVKVQWTRKIEVEALLDTGSSIGTISRELAEKAGLPIFEEQELDVELSDKRSVKRKPAVAMIEIDGCRSFIPISVAEKPLYPLTIGMFQMEMMGVKIDAQKGYTVTCKPPRA